MNTSVAFSASSRKSFLIDKNLIDLSWSFHNPQRANQRIKPIFLSLCYHHEKILCVIKMNCVDIIFTTFFFGARFYMDFHEGSLYEEAFFELHGRNQEVIDLNSNHAANAIALANAISKQLTAHQVQIDGTYTEDILRSYVRGTHPSSPKDDDIWGEYEAYRFFLGTLPLTSEQILCLVELGADPGLCYEYLAEVCASATNEPS